MPGGAEGGRAREQRHEHGTRQARPQAFGCGQPGRLAAVIPLLSLPPSLPHFLTAKSILMADISLIMREEYE